MRSAVHSTYQLERRSPISFTRVASCASRWPILHRSGCHDSRQLRRFSQEGGAELQRSAGPHSARGDVERDSGKAFRRSARCVRWGLSERVFRAEIRLEDLDGRGGCGGSSSRHWNRAWAVECFDWSCSKDCHADSSSSKSTTCFVTGGGE